jgi:hypothetical protein
MANYTTPFKKVTPPRSAEDYLKELEQLMRLNRGGGLHVGYDTESNRPIYLPGKVSDPTGLTDYASNPLLNLPKVPQSDYSFLNDLLGVDVTDMTEEEIIPIIEGLTENTQGLIDNLNQEIYKPASTEPPVEPSPTPSIQPKKSYPVASPTPSVRPIPRILPPSAPSQPVQTEFNQTMQQTGDMLRRVDELSNSVTPEAPQPTLSPKQFSEQLNIPAEHYIEGVTAKDVENINALKNRPDYYQLLGKSFREHTDEAKAKEMGITTDQLNDMNNMDLPTIYNPQTSNANSGKINPIKSARLALGNFVEGVGDAIPGFGEHNVSEWIAGGPTRHTGQARAAEDINISEPDETNYQAGAGIETLQRGLQPGNVQQSTRPPVNSINPAAPVIGNFAGIPASAVQSAGKGVNQTVNNPAQMTPINPVLSQSMPKPMGFSTSQNQSSGNNQSSNQSNNSGNSSARPTTTTVKQSVPVSAKKVTSTQPIATPTKYIPPNQPIQAPLATYGVGSASPSPASKPAASSNVFTSVANAIKNLFRRK